MPDNIIKIETDEDTETDKNRGIVTITATINGLTSSIDLIIIGQDTEVISFNNNDAGKYKKVSNENCPEIFTYVENEDSLARTESEISLNYTYINYDFNNYIKKSDKYTEYKSLRGFMIPNKNDLKYTRMNITDGENVYSLGLVDEEQLFNKIEALPQVPETLYTNESVTIIADIEAADSYESLMGVTYKAEGVDVDPYLLISRLSIELGKDDTGVTDIVVSDKNGVSVGTYTFAILPKWFKGPYDIISEASENPMNALNEYYNELESLNIDAISVKINVENK